MPSVDRVNTKLDESHLAAEVEHIYRAAYRLTGNPADAEDLVQDVCERALRSGPDFAAALDRRRWMLRVLYNCFVDGRRRKKRSPLVASKAAEESVREFTSNGPSPEDLAAQCDSESALMRAWERLDSAQQMLLLLRAEGHELEEIARIMEIDKPALSSRLHRARSSLARYLEEERAGQTHRAISEELR
jgi:RNA polymerase sigma-70 factor (ECF subfamily)